MKVNYKPSGPSRKDPPKQWEVWLADTPFGEIGRKRCPVLVAKRTPQGYTVHEIIPMSLKGGKDVTISDPMRAGQDRPMAIRTSNPAVIQNSAFVQRMGTVTEADISKFISNRA